MAEMSDDLTKLMNGDPATFSSGYAGKGEESVYDRTGFPPVKIAPSSPMSDDLIKQWDEYVESMGSVMGEVEHMAQKMRDRIEQLERENAEMAAAITDAENGGICSEGNLWRFWARTAREAALARADERSASGYKLAKAVELGNNMASFIRSHYIPSVAAEWEDMLAELEGRND
jgi:hypothetical protein